MNMNIERIHLLANRAKASVYKRKNFMGASKEWGVRFDFNDRLTDFVNLVIGDETKDLQQKLLQSQASEARFREALEVAKLELEAQGCNEPYADENSQLSYRMINEALSTPPNTAELESFVAKAVESEIERRLGDKK